MEDFHYSLESLKKDYKSGMILGISFCLFALPSLTRTNSNANQLDPNDEIDGNNKNFEEEIDEIVRQKVIDGMLDICESF